MAKRLYIVAYDIADAKRWRRVFKKMHGYGEWLQLSVFRCRLTAARRAGLARDLGGLIEPAEDRVLIVDLGPLPRALGVVEALGRDPAEPNEGPWIA